MISGQSSSQVLFTLLHLMNHRTTITLSAFFHTQRVNQTWAILPLMSYLKMLSSQYTSLQLAATAIINPANSYDGTQSTQNWKRREGRDKKEACAVRHRNVKFDDGSTQEFSSAQLGIYKEYHNKHSQTPVKDALKTIKKAVHKTVGRRRGRKIRRNNISSSRSDGSISSSGSGSAQSKSRKSDEDDMSQAASSLMTPRPLEESPRPVVNLPHQRQLFSDPASDSESSSVGGSFDDLEEEEEDGDGTDKLQIIIQTEDGGEQADFLDRPMKKAAYEKSYEIMKEEKSKLIESKHVITKTVKAQNKYAVGGKVVGAPNSIKKDQLGTIIEVCGDNVFIIEWDDDNMIPCRMEKKCLRLQKETGQMYQWVVIADHVAPNPPTKYEQVGVVDFSMKDFNAMPGDDDYNHPFARLVEALWPGDWRKQLAKMNTHLRANKCLGKKATLDGGLLGDLNISCKS